MIRSRWLSVDALAVTIKPPLERARMPRRRARSRRIAHVDRAAPPPRATAPRPGLRRIGRSRRICEIPKDCRSRHARRDLLEQFQPFAAQAVFEDDETGGVAARPRQAIDEAGADRIGDITNTIGTVRVACSNAAARGRCRSQDDVRRERDQFGRIFANFVGIVRAQRVSIRTLRPSVQPNCCKPCRKRRDAGLSFRIVRG